MGRLLKDADTVAGEPVVAGTMVSGPGTSDSPIGGGGLGAATRSVLEHLDERRHGTTPRPSPLPHGQAGYLAVTASRLLLMEIKVGTFSTRAARVLAEVPREEVNGADFSGGMAMIPLLIEFTDGTAWHFTVAKIYAGTARAVVAALTT